MLDSVLFARDKYLDRVKGIMLPDKAVLYICGIEDADYRDRKINFWNSVYGFDMSCIRDIAMMEPLVDVANPEAVVTDAQPILALDLATCTKADLTFESKFTLQVARDDYCHAFLAFFDFAFTQV